MVHARNSRNKRKGNLGFVGIEESIRFLGPYPAPLRHYSQRRVRAGRRSESQRGYNAARRDACYDEAHYGERGVMVGVRSLYLAVFGEEAQVSVPNLCRH